MFGGRISSIIESTAVAFISLILSKDIKQNNNNNHNDVRKNEPPDETRNIFVFLSKRRTMVKR